MAIDYTVDTSWHPAATNQLDDAILHRRAVNLVGDHGVILTASLICGATAISFTAKSAYMTRYTFDSAGRCQSTARSASPGFASAPA